MKRGYSQQFDSKSVSGPIFVIDDDVVYRERVGQAIRSRGYAVTVIDDPARILDEGLPSPEGCAIVDLRMPSVSGLEVVSAISSRNPAIKVIVVTGYGSIATAVEAMRRGAFSYLTKPVGVSEMLAAFGEDSAQNTSISIESTPSLAQVEWEHINAVLNRCNGNITKTAQELGLHRRSLQRKLRERPPQ